MVPVNADASVDHVLDIVGVVTEASNAVTAEKFNDVSFDPGIVCITGYGVPDIEYAAVSQGDILPGQKDTVSRGRLPQCCRPALGAVCRGDGQVVEFNVFSLLDSDKGLIWIFASTRQDNQPFDAQAGAAFNKQLVHFRDRVILCGYGQWGLEVKPVQDDRAMRS